MSACADITVDKRDSVDIGKQNKYRELDEALKAENEKKMLLIPVNSLENQVRKRKEKIEAMS